MIKCIKLTHFTTYYQDFENNKDYVLRIKYEPDPNNEDEIDFGKYSGYILYPHTFGLIDTTITDSEYDCIIYYDNSLINTDKNMYFYDAFFRKKLKNDLVEIKPEEQSNVSQTPSERVGTSFRALKGPSGDTALLLGKSSAELTVGENKLLISKNGLSLYGEIMSYNVPGLSYGGIYKQTGIMNFIPDVPPFAQIKMLPDVSFVMRVTEYLEVFKTIQDVINI